MKYRIRIEREISGGERPQYSWEEVYEQTVEELNVKQVVNLILLNSK